MPTACRVYQLQNFFNVTIWPGFTTDPDSLKEDEHFDSYIESS